MHCAIGVHSYAQVVLEDASVLDPLSSAMVTSYTEVPQPMIWAVNECTRLTGDVQAADFLRPSHCL